MILLDVESRSRAKLRELGGRAYWRHPSSEVLCLVWYDTDTGDAGAWVPGMAPPPIAGRECAAHNMMGFDRFALERMGWHPSRLVDTAQLARRAGLPGALDALGTRWLGIPKDKIASRFTTSLSTPSRAAKTRGQLKPITGEIQRRVVDYCASDVRIMAEGWELLEPWLDLEPDVERVERVVNDRGVAFDSDLARALLRADDALAERTAHEVADVIGETPWRAREMARSPAQFTDLTGAENAQKATVDELTRHPDRRVRALATLRQASASIASGKLRAGLARVCPDGRMRDMMRYCGAHTWRWSGQGFQPHNLTRPAKQFENFGDDDMCRTADRALAGEALERDEIDLMLRATLVAPPGKRLVVCDFSGVEARALAWVAGDQAALDVFASDVEPYIVAATHVYGIPYDAVTKTQRTIGKIAELACGYGGGVNAFTKFADGYGIDLSDVNVDAVVQAWRRAHAPTVRFWWALSDAFEHACAGRNAWVDRFEFVPSDDGRDVALYLPSGRPVVYNEARASRAMRDGRPRTELSYLGARFREHLYGGKLAENAIQAMCRDLLADALVRAERAGLRVVLHVHDELVCEVNAGEEKEALAELTRIMLTLPEWARGFPIGAAGFTGRRYRK